MIWTGSVDTPLRRFALPLATAVLALLGLALIAWGTDPVEGTSTPPARESSGIGIPKRTSYGWVTVTHVERIRGLTAKELGGMTHGVKNLVDPDQVLVAVG